MDYVNQRAYLVEIPSSSSSTNSNTVDSLLVQVDLKTGKRVVMLKQSALTRVFLSPTGRRGLVMMYWSDGYHAIELVACILDVSSSTCTKTTTPEVFLGLTWLDDDHVMSAGGKNLRLTDVTPDLPSHDDPPGLENWIILDYRVYPIPNTHQIAFEGSPVNATEFIRTFLIYDADTHQTTVLPYGFIDKSYRLPTGIAVSPHKKYFAYCHNYPDVNKCAVVDFKTGKLMLELHDISSFVWTPDDKILDVTKLTDPATGQQTTISLPDGAVMMHYCGSGCLSRDCYSNRTPKLNGGGV
ncbi:MAG: hypothetical protein ACYDBJ_00895 [Aggregatilineales bacterium]